MCVFKIVLKCCWPLKLERKNARLFAWQLFPVHPERCSVGGGTCDRLSSPFAVPLPWKFIDRQGVRAKWFIYDNGAWWHHAIKALGGVTQHMPLRVRAFVFAMHEYRRGRAGHWLTLLLCDGWRRRLCFCFVFFNHLFTCFSPLLPFLLKNTIDCTVWTPTALSRCLDISFVSIQVADYSMFLPTF